MKETVTLYVAESSSLSSHELLRKAAADAFGYDPEELYTEKAPGGKPHFPLHPAIHFSVSHSGVFWICAFARDEIGCDVQQHTEPKRRGDIALRYFSPNELAYYRAQGEELAVFHRIWSRKEAAVKKTGHGIDRTFSETDVLSPRCGILDVQLSREGYSCAVAYRGDFEIAVRVF